MDSNFEWTTGEKEMNMALNLTKRELIQVNAIECDYT
jgi:hypothetical protein